MRLLSPAKVNLYLRILSKRKDGYHNIETLFERIRLFDDITLLPAASGIHLKTAGADIPDGPQNLVYRAALLLKESCGVKKGVRIRLRKRIPVSAGLGGGSSNAATTLLGLNRFWKLGLGRKRLLELGAQLGSDVPFFLLETSFAIGRGRGERLEKLRGPKLWHCLVKPDFGISTQEAYAAWARRNSRHHPSLTPPRGDVKMLLHSWQKGGWGQVSQLLNNSLEVILNKRFTEIEKIKRALSDRGAVGSLLSGSGSSVFGVFQNSKKAHAAARSLKKNKRWRVFVASTF